jgi:hypothetical protein
MSIRPMVGGQAMSFHDVATRRNNGLHPRPFHELPPLPIPAGDPPYRMWAADGRPPCGFRFLGCRRTRLGWFSPCPACASAWVLLVPDDDNGAEPYRIAAELGCSGETCPPELIVWAHLVQVGELPIPEPDERSWFYIRGAAGKAGPRIVEAADPTAQLGRETFNTAQLAAGEGVDPILVARAMAVAASQAGIPAGIASRVIHQNLLAGLAQPRRMRREL